MRIAQEFYCNDCDGYFIAYLSNDKKKYTIEVVCPNCGREHPRKIDNGRIIDGWPLDAASYKIRSMPSTYSKTPRHEETKSIRGGMVLPFGSLAQKKRDEEYRKIGEV